MKPTIQLTMFALLALTVACPAARPKDGEPTADDGAEGTGAAVPGDGDGEPAASSSSSSSSSSGDSGEASTTCEDKLAKAEADLAACQSAAQK